MPAAVGAAVIGQNREGVGMRQQAAGRQDGNEKNEEDTSHVCLMTPGGRFLSSANVAHWRQENL